MTSERMPVPAGTVLDGKYRVDRLLGRGGMGVVMAARHLILDTDVALKFLLVASSKPEVLERFNREARAAARLQSEHVARVLDVSALADGSPYIVMEYLAGADLAHVLERGPLSVTAAVDYVVQACDAIAEAHAAGIVHRDLKPANLFLASRARGQPIIKVLDFGISRGGAPAGGLTLTGTGMLGSPQYMSPEQWATSRSVDARSDVWSLGVVLYEMLAGRRPFEGDSVPMIYVATTQGTPAPLPANVPPGLEAIVRQCLEKDPAARFPDASALAAAIGPFASAASRPLIERIAHGPGRISQAALETLQTSDTMASGFEAVGGTLIMGGSRGGGTAILDAVGGEVDEAEQARSPHTGATGARGPARGMTDAPPRAATGASAPAGATAPGAGPKISTAPGFGPKAPTGASVKPATVRHGSAEAGREIRPAEAPPARPWPLIAAGGIAFVLVVAVGAWRIGSSGSKHDADRREADRTSTLPVAPSREAPPPTNVPPATAPPAATAPASLPAQAAPVAPTPIAAPPEPAPRPPAQPTPAPEPPPVVTTRARPKDRAAPPASGGKKWSDLCSRQLERQSLGETLNPQEMAEYVRNCRR